jgi:hypothetical protein
VEVRATVEVRAAVDARWGHGCHGRGRVRRQVTDELRAALRARGKRGGRATLGSVAEGGARGGSGASERTPHSGRTEGIAAGGRDGELR